MAASSPKAKAVAIMGIRAMAEETQVAKPEVPATLPTENMAVPDTTRPTAAPYAALKPSTRFSFVG